MTWKHSARIAVGFGAILVSACKGPLQSEAPPPAVPAEVAKENTQIGPRTSPLSVGDRAPQFVLSDQNGDPVSSGELLSGKGSLLAFAPGADSPAARSVYEWARNQSAFLKQQGIEILIVTPDAPAKNRTVAERENLHVALLSDPGSWISRGFGATDKKSAAAFYYLIGSDARVQYATAGAPDAPMILMAAETKPGAAKKGFF
ncbi:hypothetical protein BH09SUM1_BH09SUM1_01910 [soil metagenome]